MRMDRSDWLPELTTHTYWDHKEQFLLESDTYVTWVLFAVKEGSFAYQIEGDSGEARFGDVVICPPYVAFHRKTVTPLSFHAITFDFPAGDIPVLQKLLSDRKVSLTRTRRLLENYESLIQEDRQPKLYPDNKRRKQHYFVDLWLMILDVYRPQPEGGFIADSDELIKKVAQYFENHADQKLEVKKVAAEFGMTPVQLIRRFNGVYHLNPLQYLTSIRIKKACSLLLQTDWNLDVIAGECGYENGFYLSRVFSRHMGMSPSIYRAQNRF